MDQAESRLGPRMLDEVSMVSGLMCERTNRIFVVRAETDSRHFYHTYHISYQVGRHTHRARRVSVGGKVDSVDIFNWDEK